MRVDDVRAFLEPRVSQRYIRGKPEFDDVLAVLTDHPVWGPRMHDVFGIRVQKSLLNGAVQLQLLTNRVWFTVSWRRCATRQRARRAGVQPVAERRLTSAMRHAIRPQTQAWKRAQHGRWVCAACGTFVGPFHADHVAPPFSEIKAMFLKREGDAGSGPPPVCFGIDPVSCASTFRDPDAAFKERWQAFHAHHAVYQQLCAPCNLSKSNRA